MEPRFHARSFLIFSLSSASHAVVKYVREMVATIDCRMIAPATDRSGLPDLWAPHLVAKALARGVAVRPARVPQGMGPPRELKDVSLPQTPRAASIAQRATITPPQAPKARHADALKAGHAALAALAPQRMRENPLTEPIRRVTRPSRAAADGRVSARDQRRRGICGRRCGDAGRGRPAFSVNRCGPVPSGAARPRASAIRA